MHLLVSEQYIDSCTYYTYFFLMRSVNLFPSPKVSDQVLYPYKITGEFIYLCIFLALPYPIGNGKLNSLENGFKHSPDVISSFNFCMLF